MRKPAVRRTRALPYAALLRQELSERNIRWAHNQNLPHEVSLGATPAVLYRKDDKGRHGNFYPAAYKRIQANADWRKRLQKVHTSSRKILLSRSIGYCELDSSNSSDALLMSIFCHPRILQPRSPMRSLLAIEDEVRPEFGWHPRIPLKNSHAERTEIDIRLGNLLCEAKLTETDFQTAPTRRIEVYRDLEEVFNVAELPRSEETVFSYQLLRGVLAAYASPELRFCVICDVRRPDLVADWYRVLQCVQPAHLRCRLQLVHWQELAAASPRGLQQWMREKYGIHPA